MRLGKEGGVRASFYIIYGGVTCGSGGETYTVQSEIWDSKEAAQSAAVRLAEINPTHRWYAIAKVLAFVECPKPKAGTTWLAE